MEALKKGGLAAKDMFLMENLLNQRIKQIRVVSAAVLSAVILSSKDEQTNTLDRMKLNKMLSKMEEVFQKASKNIANGKRAFGKEEKQQLEELFNEVGLDGKKASDRFIASFDSLLAVTLLEGAEKVKGDLKQEQQATQKQEDLKTEPKEKLKL